MEQIKWFLYRLLLRFVDTPAAQHLEVVAPDSIEKGEDYVWIFCSTIGELNACKPLIDKISAQENIVLITDRDCYYEAFIQHFPRAVYAKLQGYIGEGDHLASQFPPRDLIICEIPCTPNDAPCRLSYSFLREAKQLGAGIALVNGWIYGYEPACRQDSIERALFTKEYLQLFDTIAVQTKKVGEELVQKGANKEALYVTGNMKFDAVFDTSVSVKDAVSERIIGALKKPSFTTLVAGCVTDVWEYQLLIDCFLEIIKSDPHAFLVLAPRHPEKKSQLDALDGILNGAGLAYEFKSDVDVQLNNETNVLVLDTFGELRSYYSAADVCYVGRNHNILEPLAFLKPVAVLSGWESTYPSFPVYQLAVDSDLITEVESEEGLSATILALSSRSHGDWQKLTQERLAGVGNSCDKNIELLFNIRERT